MNFFKELKYLCWACLFMAGSWPALAQIMDHIPGGKTYIHSERSQTPEMNSTPIVDQSSYDITLSISGSGSSRIGYQGDPVNVAFFVHNRGAELNGVIRMEVFDYWGSRVETVLKGVTLRENSFQSINMQPHLSSPGFFSISIQVLVDGSPIVSADWSVAVLDQPRQFPDDSPFGTYTIGNTAMLADIVPKGFYSDMAKAGVKWGTVDIWWSLIETSNNVYNWAYYDHWFEEALDAGFTPIPHLFGVPPWAGGGADNLSPPVGHWEDWEDFVRAFVDRYKDWLVYLRIWNEPNVGYWRGTPEQYADLLIRASQAAKGIKPAIQIVTEIVTVGANANFLDTSFLDRIKNAGAVPHFDVLGIHNYALNNANPPEKNNYLPVYDGFMAWRNAYAPQAEPWDTEFACMAVGWANFWIGVGETHQAQWLARAHVLGFSKGLKKMVWFPGWSWTIPEPPGYNPAGLLRNDLSPRPAYVAYHTVASQLSWAAFDRFLGLTRADQYAAVFRTPEGHATALWSVNASSAGPVTLYVRPGEIPVTLVNLVGESQSLTPESSGALNLTLSEDIIFIDSSSMPSLEPYPGAVCNWECR